MKLNIENYRNISRLNFEIETGKVNYLFGVSGSGKSSIAMALKNENLEFNKKIGQNNIPTVKIDGKSVENLNFLLFNFDSPISYIHGTSNSNIYNILIED